MIIFYNKNTGDISGTIDGRINTAEELKMSMDDPNEIHKLVVTWKPVKYFDKDGNEVDPVTQRELVYAAEFQPDHPQKELFQQFDSKKLEVLKYKVDINTKQLVPI